MKNESTKHLEAWAKRHAQNATESQRKVICSPYGTKLVIAGPGSGKTHTLIQRINALIAIGEEPSQMVVITFTNAAAREVQSRLGNVQLYYVGTLHGYCLHLLRDHGTAIGFNQRIAVVDEKRAIEIMEEVGKTLGVKSDGEKLMKQRNLQGVVEAPKTPEEIAIATYAKRLKASSAVDFTGILEAGCQLFRLGAIDAATPLPCMRAVRWMFVDEYQDSGPLDAEFYAHYENIGANLFYVGDPDQSIYGFRGANIHNILEMAKRPGVEVYRMEENFRCPANICRNADRLIFQNRNRVDKSTRATQPGGDTASLAFGTDAQEAQGVALYIESLIADGAKPDEVAVLGRNWSIIHPIAEALDGLGIPVKRAAKTTAETFRLGVLLAALDAPANDFAALRWIEVSKGKKAAQAMQRLAVAEQKAPAQVVRLPDLSKAWGAQLLDGLARLGCGVAEIEATRAAMGRIVTPGLSALAREIADSDGAEGTKGATLTTIHGSKGREWPHVVLAGAEARIIPGRGDMEEERRLAFVAATRASQSFLATYANARKATWGAKELLPGQPSLFLAELGLL